MCVVLFHFFMCLVFLSCFMCVYVCMCGRFLFSFLLVLLFLKAPDFFRSAFLHFAVCVASEVGFATSLNVTQTGGWMGERIGGRIIRNKFHTSARSDADHLEPRSYYRVAQF